MSRLRRRTASCAAMASRQASSGARSVSFSPVGTYSTKNTALQPFFSKEEMKGRAMTSSRFRAVTVTETPKSIRRCPRAPMASSTFR